MNKLARSILKYRWLIIIFVAVLTGFLGYQIRYIQINSDVISTLPDDDPDALLFKKIGEEFGGNKIGMVILEANDIFTNESLGHIAQLTDTISSIEGVSGVTSMTSILDIRGDEFGFEVSELVSEYELPYSDEELEKLRERVMSKDRYRGNIVSADGSAALVMFTVLDDYDIKEVGRKVINKSESIGLPEKLYFAGLPMMVTAIAELVSSDLIKLIPIAFILITLVLLLNFGTFRGVFLPLLASAIAITWTLGFMALFGFEMTMVTNNIPIILLAVGSAYTIHVINKVNQLRERYYHRAIIVAVAYIFIPVLLTALTTIAGFISFVFEAYLGMIKDFGVFTAVGTLFSALLALFFVPALLYVISPAKVRKSDYGESGRSSIYLERLLMPLKNLLLKHPKYILTTWSALVIISIGGIFLIERNVDIKDYFKHDSMARQAEEIMIEKFGGSKAIFILFEADMQDPSTLKTMMRTVDYIKQDPNVLNAQSVAELIADLYEALGEERKIPDDRAAIEQLWFFIDGNPMLERLVSEDLQEGIIISKFASSDNQAKEEFAEGLQKFLDENSCEDCRIQLTGMPFIDLKMNASLLKSQVRSLTLAIIALLLLVGVMLRSFATGAIATFPVIATIVILFGLMGFTGIPLNVATVLVASVALGIGVDYSIHIISYFDYSYILTTDFKEALERTVMVTGKAIIINVVSVSLGFLVLVFSDMVPLQYFGMLMAFSMVGSGLASMTLLPVILILVKRRKLSLNNNEE